MPIKHRPHLIVIDFGLNRVHSPQLKLACAPFTSDYRDPGELWNGPTPAVAAVDGMCTAYIEIVVFVWALYWNILKLSRGRVHTTGGGIRRREAREMRRSVSTRRERHNDNGHSTDNEHEWRCALPLGRLDVLHTTDREHWVNAALSSVRTCRGLHALARFTVPLQGAYIMHIYARTDTCVTSYPALSFCPTRDLTLQMFICLICYRCVMLANLVKSR